MKVSIICITTLCGSIEPAGFGSKEDRKRLEAMRSQTDASLLGASSLRKSDPEMKTSLNIIPDSRIRCIISESGNIPSDKKIFHIGPPPVIFTSGKGAGNISADIKKRARIKVVPTHTYGGLDLEAVIRILDKLHVRHLLIEGGGRLNHSAIKQGIVDELLLTLAPKISGAEGLATLAHGPDSVGNPFVDLKLLSMKMAENGDELFLRYRFRK